MHLVERSNEPHGLKDIRERLTSRWERHYTSGEGNKPTDDYWRSFHKDVKRDFGGICGYCESRPKGQIDHFKPKSRYPKLVYYWNNWVFACHDCNHAKGRGFPKSGYVNPCELVEGLRPEGYFTFDTVTCEIIARPGLSDRERERAQGMVDDLRLNDLHHIANRSDAIAAVAERFANGPVEPTSSTGQWVTQRTASDCPYSSAVRAWLSEHGFPVED